MTAIIVTAIICATLVIIFGIGAWGASRKGSDSDDPFNRY